MIKTHRTTYEGLLNALQMSFLENQHAEKMLQKELKSHRKWGSKDRKFVATQFYSFVRWYERIQFATNTDEIETLMNNPKWQ